MQIWCLRAAAHSIYSHGISCEGCNVKGRQCGPLQATRLACEQLVERLAPIMEEHQDWNKAIQSVYADPVNQFSPAGVRRCHPPLHSYSHLAPKSFSAV